MSGWRQCTRCVMDTTDPDIFFDDQGVCSHCQRYEREVKAEILPPDAAARWFDKTLGEIRQAGRGKQYDCLLGISGGVDSSYLAYLAWKHGLRTLLVHMDNGWDSELAVRNIENIVRTTGFDYFNHVVDWEEFRDLQLAYLRASVIDIEVVTDQAITALIYRTGARFDIRYILTGENIVTEAILPQAWCFSTKNDLANLRAIHACYGERPLRTYPMLALYQRRTFQAVRDFQYVPLLNYVPYDQAETVRTLEGEFGWRSYGGKHCESIFTKFYQAYILPVKFHVDKRKAHLSSLICSGQLSREEALARLATPVYKPGELEVECAYVLKKLGLTPAEFEAIMARPIVPHSAFATEKTDLSYRLRGAAWDFAGRQVLRGRRLRRHLRPMVPDLTIREWRL